jgi:hypothetical protein
MASSVCGNSIMSEEICADHEMPASMDKKLKLLDTIIRTGIEKLLSEAKKRHFLHPPYGRPPAPNPLVSEDEFLRTCSAADYQHISDEPAFHYIYGFNPLTFLADYIHWAHPDSFLSRKNEVEKCYNRLKLRARHACHKLKTAESLAETAAIQRSGLLWGPICSSINSTTALCLCKVARAGTVCVEVSEYSDFSEIHKLYEVDIQESNMNVPSKIRLDDLKPTTLYFVRACLRDLDYPPKVVIAPPPSSPTPPQGKLAKGLSKFTSLKNGAPPAEEAASPPKEISYDYRFGGIQDGFFQSSQFWTIPKNPKETTEDAEKAAEAAATPSAKSKFTSSLLSKKEPEAKEEPVAVAKAAAEEGDATDKNQFTVLAAGNVFNADPSNDIANESLGGHFMLDLDKVCELVGQGLDADSRFLTCILGDVFSRQPYSGYASNARDYLRDVALSGASNQTVPEEAEVPAEEGAEPQPQLSSMVRQMNVDIEAARSQLDLEMSKVLEVYMNRVRLSMVKCLPFGHTSSILRRSNLLLAWNDLRVGSDTDLKYEELAVKKHQSDVKRYNRKYEAELKKRAQSKRATGLAGASQSTNNLAAAAAAALSGTTEIPPPPTLQLPPISPSVQALLQVRELSFP